MRNRNRQFLSPLLPGLVALLVLLQHCEFFGMGGLDGDPQIQFQSDELGICFQYYVDKNADPEAIKTQIQLHKVNLKLQSISIRDLKEVESCQQLVPVAYCIDRMQAQVGKKKLPVESQLKLIYNKEHWPDLEVARRDCHRRTGQKSKFVIK